MVEEIRALVPAIDARMLAGLQALYEIESAEWRDSRGECSGISLQVAKQFGLLYVEGQFRLDAALKVGEAKLFEDHAWCVDGSMRIIDLTAEQFNPGLYNKIAKGPLIIGREDVLFPRYRPGKIVRHA